MNLQYYSRIERKRFSRIFLFLLPTIILFIMFYLMPIVTVLFTSFTRWDGFTAPLFNGVNNYLRLFRQGSFLISMRNFINWSIIAVVGHVGFGVMIAFFLYRRPWGWKIVRSTFMIPNVVSAAAWAMIYKFIFNNEFGVLNTLIRYVAPGFSVNWFYQSPAAFWAVTFTWLFYAVIVTLIVLGDLMAIPKETIEAAEIDGAGGMQLNRYIKLPLCRNSIGTAVILSITSRIAMYENIALTTRGGPGDDTMGLALILVNNINDYNYGMANATAMIMFVIGILTLLVINRLFRMNEPL